MLLRWPAGWRSGGILAVKAGVGRQAHSRLPMPVIALPEKVMSRK